MSDVDCAAAQALGSLAGVKMPNIPGMTLSPKDKARVMDVATYPLLTLPPMDSVVDAEVPPAPNYNTVTTIPPPNFSAA